MTTRLSSISLFTWVDLLYPMMFFSVDLMIDSSLILIPVSSTVGYQAIETKYILCGKIYFQPLNIFPFSEMYWQYVSRY